RQKQAQHARQDGDQEIRSRRSQACDLHRSQDQVSLTGYTGLAFVVAGLLRRDTGSCCHGSSFPSSTALAEFAASAVSTTFGNLCRCLQPSEIDVMKRALRCCSAPSASHVPLYFNSNLLAEVAMYEAASRTQSIQ